MLVKMTNNKAQMTKQYQMSNDQISKRCVLKFGHLFFEFVLSFVLCHLTIG